MTDELDRLKSALSRATPAPNSDARARAVAAAAEKFTDIQGSPDAARPMSDRPQNAGGFWTGAKHMLNSIGLRPALYATSCIVMAGFVMVTVQPFDFTTPPMQAKRLEKTDEVLVATPKPTAPRTRLDDTDGAGDPNLAIPAEAEYRDATSGSAAQTTMPEMTVPKVTVPKGKATKTEADTARARTLPTVQNNAPVSADKKERQQASEESFALPLQKQTLSEQLAPIVGNETGAVASIVRIAPPTPELDIIARVEPTPGDQFTAFEQNPVKSVRTEPVSTFSIDVDTASYAYVRRAVLNGNRPQADAVRIEEMINYFPYDYAAPDVSEAPFSTSVSVLQTPWNPDTKLVHIGIQGAKPALDDRQPLNLVFLIDTSGSMQAANKLPLLKQSFRLLLTSLRPTDQVAIVTYAGSAGTVLEPTSASEKNKILDSLNRLSAGGSTAGQAGLQQAYALAEDMARDDGNGDQIGRVILATDGDFNVGISDPERLKSFVEDKRETGVYLSVLGFGDGNYRDDMMQTLAQNGNGTAAYIDTLAEAQKVLVDQVSGALFPIANDVKIQVEFNPAQIAEYRLIGYETRALNREDFNNDKVDAGEIGAGHTVTALYEVTPVGSPAIKNDPLRYATEETSDQPTSVGNDTLEYGYLKLRYKDPGASRSNLIETPIFQTRTDATREASFAAAIAGFGQLLTGATYLNDWGWDEAIALAQSSRGQDVFGYRAEAIRLMQLAQSVE